MSKIAIISRPDQGVLIDVTGCTTMQEAVEHMTSTLQVGSQFWKGLAVDLNLGNLKLSSEQVGQILDIAKGLGVVPKEVFSDDAGTVSALENHGITIGCGRPPTLANQMSDIETKSEQTDAQSALDRQWQGQIDTTNRRIVMYQDDELLALGDAKTEEGLLDKEATQKTASANTAGPDSILYLKQTLRSGQAVSHKGHLVIIGDVNAGAEVVAEGDITVWGSLRGVAHAGLGGNCQAEIRALKLQPIQIRIADSIARSPDPPKAGQLSGWGPESARLVDGRIRILRNTLD